MKKIYTLLLVTCISMAAFSQSYDISATWAALTDGEVFEDLELDATFILTNEGDEAIPMGDTLVYGYTIDGTSGAFVDGPFVAGYYYYVELEEDFAAGATMTVGVSLTFSGTSNFDFCAKAHGVGAASYDTYEGDTDDSNNLTCITVDVEVEDDASIENLENVLNNVYVANGQLNIVNNAVFTNQVANLNIINISGQTVQTENIVLTGGTSMIELNNLSSGIYLVSVEVEGSVVTRKISIQ